MAKRTYPILSVLAAALILLLAAYVYVVASSVSVCGTATLPGGLVATITGQFDASENAGRTSVEAGGRKFVFTPSVIIVDGMPVANLDPSVIQVAMDATGRDAELSLNGKPIPLPPR
jgi:hypothetical protein